MVRSLIYVRPFAVVFVRAYGAYAKSVNLAWGRMFQWMDDNGLGAEVDVGYGLAHDDPRRTAPELCRYDACIALPKDVPAERLAELDRRILPPGVYAREQLTGSYEAMGDLVSCIRDDWVPRHGLAVDSGRPVMTIYRNSPRYFPANELRADICLPITAPTASRPLLKAA